MNLFSNNVSSLIFQHRVNAHTKFSPTATMAIRRPLPGPFLRAHRGIKFLKLGILAD
jgi:hypothetical protein